MKAKPSVVPTHIWKRMQAAKSFCRQLDLETAAKPEREPIPPMPANDGSELSWKPEHRDTPEEIAERQRRKVWEEEQRKRRAAEEAAKRAAETARLKAEADARSLAYAEARARERAANAQEEAKRVAAHEAAQETRWQEEIIENGKPWSERLLPATPEWDGMVVREVNGVLFYCDGRPARLRRNWEGKYLTDDGQQVRLQR